MEAEELRERVNGFERWHYTIDLGHGVVTPGPKKTNRVEQRRRYFFDPLVALSGGLEGMRVLDLGSNAGYWSLCAIEAGADFVLGIEGRQMHVDQANLVFEAKGVDPDRYHFEVGNFFTYPFDSFDVVLCLGVLYHVSDPVELFNIMAATKADLLVIDTAVSQLPGNAFAIGTEPTESYRNAIEGSVVLYPTRGVVHRLARFHGYESVALDRSVIEGPGVSDYRQGDRVAFIASRTRDLSALAQETPLPKPSLRWRLGRRLRRDAKEPHDPKARA